MSEIPLAHEVLQFTRCSNQVFTRIKAAARRLRRDQVWDDLDDARVVRTTKHALGARQVVIEEGRVGEGAADVAEEGTSARRREGSLRHARSALCRRHILRHLSRRRRRGGSPRRGRAELPLGIAPRSSRTIRPTARGRRRELPADSAASAGGHGLGGHDHLDLKRIARPVEVLSGAQPAPLRRGL